MSSEILIDGSFESSDTGHLPLPPTSGWYTTSSSSRPFVDNSLHAYDGTKYLVFTPGSMHASQDLSVSFNVDYRLRYYVKTIGNFNPNDYFQIKWGGNVINHSKLTGNDLMAMRSYQEFEFVVTALDFLSPIITLTFEAFITSTTGIILLDNVSVKTSVVRNGNFESGDFCPWYLSNPSQGLVLTESSNYPAHSGIYFAHSGIYFARLGITTMEQTLYTIPGATYELSFWIRKVGIYVNNDFFEVQWNNTIVGSQVNSGNPEGTIDQYKRFSFEVTADSDLRKPSLLKFVFNVTSIFFPLLIDDVAVTLKTLPDPIPCYLKGTHILTPKGELLIEDLKEGDEIFTYENGKLNVDKIKWKGSLIPKVLNDDSYPIKICNSAIRKGVPHRDLFVSPGHSVLIDGKLVPAKSLDNGLTIYQDKSVKNVQYYHIELSRHSIVFAEGMCAESYLDVGNRNSFSTKV
ncbi:MAG: Hint domain-containing protein [Candidatus Pacearchaeota archaeon]